MNSFPFDAVIFDLDGTLVATERYWPDAARSATRTFFADRGITHGIPTTVEWMSMVGRPLEEAFAESFAGLEADVRDGLMEACERAESRRLGRGLAETIQSVPETLDMLEICGVRLGVASNCGTDYLDAMMSGLGLSRWIEEARCLRSPGVHSKADMIADILAHFDTRSAVMVGDRRGDRDAAWENGLPFIHIPRGYGGSQEEVHSEAVLDGIDQLIARLEQRDVALREALADIPEAKTVAIVGLPLAGKTIFARDLRRVAEEMGRELEVLDDPQPGTLSACDAAIGLTASEEVLVRRARGLRVGVAPVVALLESLPAAYAKLEAEPPALVIDAANPLLPERVS
jgi:phosphoglycolate phosphatase